MTINDIVLAAEEARELQKLKDNFNIRYQVSPLKKSLLSKEIKGYSLLFDEKNLPLSGALNENEVPLRGYSIPEYCSMQIWLIREFWMHYFVEGNDIAEIDKFEPDSWFWNLNDFAQEWLANPRLYYNLAIIYCKYLDWLSRFKNEGLTKAELALIKVYNREILINDKTKLYQNWAKYSSKYNRTGTELSELKNRNKIKLLEKVIDKLSGEAKINAEKDLKELKFNIEDQGFAK